jgi:hypothetical protein
MKKRVGRSHRGGRHFLCAKGRAAMNRTEKLLAVVELEQNLLKFWDDVDNNWGENASLYYAPEGEWVSGRSVFRGREEIQKFYSAREARGERVSVHGVLNFEADVHDDGTATARWYMLLYAADGKAPLPSEAPTRLSRATETFRYDEGEQRWLCTRRTFDLLFVGGNQLGGPAPVQKK